MQLLENKDRGIKSNYTLTINITAISRVSSTTKTN